LKTIVFRHRTGFREDDFYEEEMTFKDNATEDEIRESYVDWILQEVEDHFSWYEKEEN
jgi:hypothetical protein